MYVVVEAKPIVIGVRGSRGNWGAGGGAGRGGEGAAAAPTLIGKHSAKIWAKRRQNSCKRGREVGQKCEKAPMCKNWWFINSKRVRIFSVAEMSEHNTLKNVFKLIYENTLRRAWCEVGEEHFCKIDCHSQGFCARTPMVPAVTPGATE